MLHTNYTKTLESRDKQPFALSNHIATTDDCDDMSLPNSSTSLPLSVSYHALANPQK
jgi:hypothetical protein